MLSGFNTNIRHNGVVFHVQTEDSGRAHPHVITHLFHGGNILASEKVGYDHLLQEKSNLESQVKRLMKAQHSAMVEKLKSGALNGVIGERLGSGSGFDAAPAEMEAAVGTPPIQKVAQDEIGGLAEDSRSTPTATPPAASSAQRPLDEVVLDYLLESARQRSKR
jgi:hypothetical protein